VRDGSHAGDAGGGSARLVRVDGGRGIPEPECSPPEALHVVEAEPAGEGRLAARAGACGSGGLDHDGRTTIKTVEGWRHDG